MLLKISAAEIILCRNVEGITTKLCYKQVIPLSAEQQLTIARRKIQQKLNTVSNEVLMSIISCTGNVQRENTNHLKQLNYTQSIQYLENIKKLTACVSNYKS